MGFTKFASAIAFSGARNNRKTHIVTSFQSKGFNGVFRTITNSQPQPDGDRNPTESLGARMSFVVQELESVQKQKTEKGVALQKLRAWRDRNSAVSATCNFQECSVVSKVEKTEEKQGEAEVAGQRFVPREIILPSSASQGAEIAHPWPEWIELMERLAEHNYFDLRRSNEDDVIEKLSGGECGYKDEGVDIFKDLSTVRKACINFAKDRFDILRSLSRKDIQILAGYGCPSLDRKVVCSAKRLRAYVQLDEGDVCSSCKLRSSCETAYTLPREEEPANTMDVMRILMVYGLDPLIDSAENKLHKRKTVKESIRKLLKEVVRLSAIPLDPNLPKPVVKKPSPKVKVPQPPPRKRVGRDDIEMKRGDWLCPKCDFMNFAKNHNCLQCDSNRPKRELNPGEWECPECNFLNYRRNMTCYNCDHKRPEDEYTSGLGHGRDGKWADDSQQSGYPERRLGQHFDLLTTSKAWNDDFDDDESDGAEVAVFENADSSRVTDVPGMNGDRGNRKDGCFDDDPFNFDDLPVHGTERRKDQTETTGWKIQHGNERRKDHNETPGWKIRHGNERRRDQNETSGWKIRHGNERRDQNETPGWKIRDKGNRKDGSFDDDSFDFDDLPMHGTERRKDQNDSRGWKIQGKGNRKDGRIDDDSFDFDDLPMHGMERRKDQNESRGWKIRHGNERRKDPNDTPGWKVGHGNERRKDRNETPGWKIGHGNERRKDHNRTAGWKTGHNDHWNSRESRGLF